MAGVLLLRAVDVRRRREGEEYLKLTLGNRTGILPAVVLDGVPAARAVCRSGEVVHVVGAFSVHPTHGGRLVVEAIRCAEPDEYDPDLVLDGPIRPVAQLEADLRELIATVQDPHLRHLLETILGDDAPTWPLFRDAPAAKHYHQAYRHGLLEHSLTVAQAVGAISATFPGIDRDVAVTGALLHDIGKLDAYELRDDAIEMSDQGRLYGEIPLGYYRVRSAIESLDGFPQQTGPGGAPHHPQPPWLARARQPRDPVHAGGDARPHGRQPRRPAGQLRPHREGPARRRAVVPVGQGDRGRRVFRPARSLGPGRAAVEADERRAA